VEATIFVSSSVSVVVLDKDEDVDEDVMEERDLEKERGDALLPNTADLPTPTLLDAVLPLTAPLELATQKAVAVM
jgi:hypothetical protein